MVYLCKRAPNKEQDIDPDLELSASSQDEAPQDVDVARISSQSESASDQCTDRDPESTTPGTTPEGVFQMQPRIRRHSKPFEPVTLIKKSSLEDVTAGGPKDSRPEFIRSATPPYTEPVTLFSVTRQSTPVEGVKNTLEQTLERCKECVVCMSKTKTMAVVPCGHKCCCLACKDTVKQSKYCPICRGPIKEIIQIFD